MAKIYRLFKFFCLKDRIFSSFIRRPRHLGPNSKEKGEEVVNTNAMEIESDLKLLKYTDTEVLMDDFSMSMTDFMRRFEKFKVDEVSIEDAEDDICFNAKDVFDEFCVVSLTGLKYTEDEGTTEWKKGRNATRQICNCQRVFRNYLMASLKISVRFFSHSIQKTSTERLCLLSTVHTFS